MSYGMTGAIGLGKETAWGTAAFAVGSCQTFVEAMSENVTVAIDRFDTRNIYDNLFEPDDFDGVRRVAGQIVAAAHPINIGYFLNAAFGQTTSVTSIVAALQTHTFAPLTADVASNAPLPSYTFEINRDVTSSQLYAGGQLSKLQLQVGPNQDVRMTSDWLFQASSSSIVKPSTSAYPSSSNTPFAFDTASIQFGGAATSLVEALTFTFDNRLEGIPTLNNSKNIARVRRTGPQQIRLSGVMAFTNATDYNSFLTQTELAVIASFTRAASFQLLLTMPRMIYTAYPITMPGRERLTVQFEGIGRTPVAVGSFGFTAALTTTVASGSF